MITELIHFASKETILLILKEQGKSGFIFFVRIIAIVQRNTIGKKGYGDKELDPLPTELIGKSDGKNLIDNRLESWMRFKKGGTEIAILCVENQSNICNVMLVRDIGYTRRA